VHPRLREHGQATPRGPQPRVRDRDAERAQLAALMHEESRQVEAARRQPGARAGRCVCRRLARWTKPLSDLFLSLLGEALAEQAGPDAVVERHTGDGLLPCAAAAAGR
jgi:hypothetical protein